MSGSLSPEEFLAECAVDPAVFALRPDYRALLLVIDRVDPAVASSSAVELLDHAEAHAQALLAGARVNALTDIPNAVSVLQPILFGGEDFDRYEGPARSARAVGDGTFETVAGGKAAIEHPAVGEVVWRDDAATAVTEARSVPGPAARDSRRLVGAP